MDLLSRFLSVQLAVVVSAAYLRLVVTNLRPGLARALAALPVVAVNCAIPLLFDRLTEFITRGICLLLLSWLASFKALGFAVNRGPLRQPLTPLQFVLTYALPITPQLSARPGFPKVKSNSRLAHSAGGTTTLARKFAVKLLLTAAGVYVLTEFDLPILLSELVQAFLLYWFLGTIMDGPGVAIDLATGLPVAPHFDAPYLSASVSEFWSRRWNLTVGNALRFLIYDPIHEGRLLGSDKPYSHSRARSCLAICAAFFVSGAVHEGILALLERSAVSGRWLAFFAAQGPIVVCEAAAGRQAGGRRPPRWIGILYTLSLLLLLGHLFFFPPAMDSGLDARFRSSMIEAFAALT